MTSSAEAKEDIPTATTTTTITAEQRRKREGRT